jgi:hypothetical protein
MSWQPPARPEWVRAINADEVAPISLEARLPLERDALLAEARARQGLADGDLDDFGHARFPAEAMIGPLDRFLRAVAEEAELHTLGRWMTRRFLLRLLEVRLQLMRTLRVDPGILDEPIEKPLFVAGAPRTGTTLLHSLLDKDPLRRAPEGWELLRPVPPPDADPKKRAADPRIPLADHELILPQTVVSGLLSIHVFGARRPKECLSAMSFAFLSEEFSTRYAVPSYESWLTREADLGPAYKMHRLVLQVLQRRTGAARWTLKSPVHLHSLPTLFDVYPDARVAITHRDPQTMLASLSSLVANLRWAHSDVVEPAAIGRSHADRYQRTLDGLVDATEAKSLPADQIHHLTYEALAGDKRGSIEALYARLGLERSAAFDQALEADLSARPRHEHGEHHYSLEDFALDPSDLETRFARYRAGFGLRTES